MRTFLSVCAVFVAASSAPATVILNEAFNYPDQASMNAAWNAAATNVAYTLDTATGSPAGSFKLASPAANYQGKVVRNLGGDYTGTDGQPLVFSVDIYLDPAGLAALWNGARQYVELRGYTAAHYNGTTGLQDIIGLGLNNSSSDTFSNKWYQFRNYQSSAWYCLDGTTVPQRSAAWHTLKAVITTSQVNVYVDDVLAEAQTRATNYSFDSVMLGSDLTSGGQNLWIDNLKVEVLPEPATIVLLALGGLPLLRRR